MGSGFQNKKYESIRRNYEFIRKKYENIRRNYESIREKYENIRKNYEFIRNCFLYKIYYFVSKICNFSKLNLQKYAIFQKLVSENMQLRIEIMYFNRKKRSNIYEKKSN